MSTELSPVLGDYAKFRGRHFLTDQDYSREELVELLALAAQVKTLWRRCCLTPFLPGKTLAMILEHMRSEGRSSDDGGSRPPELPNL
jgi:ornithine carbamoyltransferase